MKRILELSDMKVAAVFPLTVISNAGIQSLCYYYCKLRARVTQTGIITHQLEEDLSQGVQSSNRNKIFLHGGLVRTEKNVT